VEFDRPQAISRLVYEVEEAMRERTQEARVEVSEDGGRSYRQILVQEYNFSPGSATYQHEEQRFNLLQVTHLRFTIVPNKSGSGTATLTALRLFSKAAGVAAQVRKYGPGNGAFRHPEQSTQPAVNFQAREEKGTASRHTRLRDRLCKRRSKLTHERLIRRRQPDSDLASTVNQSRI
jgi:hypothetical protein